MEDYHIRDIKELYQFYVRRLVQENIENNICNEQSVFSRCNNPRLSVESFYNRLFGSMVCCIECYIISLIYIKRLHNTVKGIITPNSTKSVVIASLMLSQKYFDEICYKTKFYADIACISESDMNFLEVEFLCKIHFSIAVFPYQYKVFYQELQQLCKTCLYGVSIPEIINVGTEECPVLKYKPIENSRTYDNHYQVTHPPGNPPPPAPTPLFYSAPIPYRPSVPLTYSSGPVSSTGYQYSPPMQYSARYPQPVPINKSQFSSPYSQPSILSVPMPTMQFNPPVVQHYQQYPYSLVCSMTLKFGFPQTLYKFTMDWLL